MTRIKVQAVEICWRCSQMRLVLFWSWARTNFFVQHYQRKHGSGRACRGQHGSCGDSSLLGAFFTKFALFACVSQWWSQAKQGVHYIYTRHTQYACRCDSDSALAMTQLGLGNGIALFPRYRHISSTYRSLALYICELAYHVTLTQLNTVLLSAANFKKWASMHYLFIILK